MVLDEGFEETLTLHRLGVLQRAGNQSENDQHDRVGVQPRPQTLAEVLAGDGSTVSTNAESVCVTAESFLNFQQRMRLILKFVRRYYEAICIIPVCHIGCDLINYGP